MGSLSRRLSGRWRWRSRVIARLRTWAGMLAVMASLALGQGAAAETTEYSRVETAHYTIEAAPGLTGTMTTLAGQIELWHTSLYSELGAPVDVHAQVTIVRSADELLAVARDRHPGSVPPEWAAGLAYPSARTIYVHVALGQDALITTLKHEISHLAMGAAAGPGGVPIWFTEGVAIRQSEPFAWDRAGLLVEAAALGRLLPLDDLSRGFPAGSARAGVAYAQSVHFVGYLQKRFGMDRFRELMRRLAGGDEHRAPFGDVVAEVFGQSVAALEAEWHEELSVWWGLVPVVLGSSTLWMAATVLLILAWRRRRAQSRQRLRDMAGLEVVDMAEDIEIAHNLRPPKKLVDPYEGRPPSVH